MQLTNVLRDVGKTSNVIEYIFRWMNEPGMTEKDLQGGKVVLNSSWEPYCHHYASGHLEEAR